MKTLAKALASLALASIGCGAPGTTLIFEDAPTGLPEALACVPTEGTPELLEKLETARALWADVGVDTSEVCVSVIEGGEREAIAEGCGYPGFPVDGCSTRSSARIQVGAWLGQQRQQDVVTHELGHLIAGFNGHIKCLDVPGDDLMCSHGGPHAPTERDAEFVLRQMPASEREPLP